MLIQLINPCHPRVLLAGIQKNNWMPAFAGMTIWVLLSLIFINPTFATTSHNIYDAKGNLIASCTDSGCEYFIYQAVSRVGVVKDHQFNHQANGIDGKTAEIVRDQTGIINSQLWIPDFHGSVIAKLTAEESETILFDAFGAVLNEEDCQDYHYTDKPRIGCTKLHNFNARFYDPTLGRFVTTDPVEQSNLNWFIYGNNNAINFYDPSGKDSVAIVDSTDNGGEEIRIGNHHIPLPLWFVDIFPMSTKNTNRATNTMAATNLDDYVIMAGSFDEARDKMVGLVERGVEIDTLHVFGHGNKKGQQRFGKDRLSLSPSDAGSYRDFLGLVSLTKKNSTIYLRGCRVGTNVPLLRTLHEDSHRTIVANEGLTFNQPIVGGIFSLTYQSVSFKQPVVMDSRRYQSLMEASKKQEPVELMTLSNR